MVARENIGTQIPTSDGRVGGKLEGGPPDRINERPALQPIRNRLLADGSHLSVRRRIELEVLPKLRCKSDLVSGDLDGSLERNNVVFLGHGQERYTRNLVRVNKSLCLTANKDTCTVLNMATHKKLQTTEKTVRRKPKAVPEVGPDGQTLAQRLTRLMVERDVGQTELARMCSEFYATFVPVTEDKVKQQHIFNLLQGQANAWCLPLVAHVFDVSDLWLQFGIGKKERRIKN
jgi:hypothetical protein